MLEKITAKLGQLVREEKPIRDFEEPPAYADTYQSLLGGRVVSGPAFGFRDEIAEPSGIVVIDQLTCLSVIFEDGPRRKFPHVRR